MDPVRSSIRHALDHDKTWLCRRGTEPTTHSGHGNVYKCANSFTCTLCLMLYQYACQRSTRFASNFSASGRSHVGAFFTSEDQKKGGSWRICHFCHTCRPKLQALVYDILLSTTAVFSYAIGPWNLSAKEQFFVGAQTVVSLLQTTQDYIRRFFYNWPCCLRQLK